MFILIRMAVLAVMFVSVAVVFAQTATATPQPQGWMVYLAKLASLVIPVLVPIAVAGIKSVMTMLPSALVPIIAIVVGALLDVVTAWLGNGAPSSWGVMSGLAGIGVREVKDQLFSKK